MTLAEAGSGHAALMDSVYRRQRHFYDATRKFYLLGRDLLIERLDVPAGGTVLEIGCGTGRNMIRAMNQYPKARYYGLDISEEMLATARNNLARHTSTNAVLAVADATTFKAADLFGRDKFDRVYISYALSMIPDWELALDCAAACVAERGSMHIVDFGQQERLPRWFRTGLRAWLAKFHVEPRADLFDVLSQSAAKFGGQVKCTQLHRGYAWHAILTRAA